MEITSRKEAKERGLKFYFTGKPCKNGEIALRRIGNCDCMCERCKEGRNHNHAIYRIENVETVRKTKKATYSKRDEYYRSKSRLWREANHEKHLNNVRSWKTNNRDKELKYRADNADRIREHNRIWAQNNQELRREYGRRYRAGNPEKRSSLQANRRAAAVRSVPAWFSEWDIFVIQEAHALAEQRGAETEIKWHVDHMIPLQASEACGLHCADNIQVIPAQMNVRKQNKMLLTEPLAWLR